MTARHMAVVHQRIEACSTELRLPTTKQCYHRLSREVSQQGGDYETYLAAVGGGTRVAAIPATVF